MVEDAQEKRGRVSHSAFTQRQHLRAGEHISLSKTKYGVIGWRVASLFDLRGHSFATDATLTFVLRDFVTLRLAETSVDGNRHPPLLGNRYCHSPNGNPASWPC